VATTPVRFGEALRRGFALAWRSPGVVGLSLFAEAGAALLSLGAGLSIAALVVGALARVLGDEPWLVALAPGAAAGALVTRLAGTHAIAPLAGALVVAALLSLALKLLWIVAGARVFGARLAGLVPPRALAAAADLRRAVPVALLFFPIYLAMLLYDLTALGSTSLAWAAALEAGRGGVAGSLGLALAVAIALVLGLAVDALLRLSLLRAVAGGVGAIDALRAAGRILGARLPTIACLWLLFAVLSAVAALVGASGGGLMAGDGATAVALAIGARAVTGLVGAVVGAFLETAHLGALAALDAEERGALPQFEASGNPALPDLEASA
jgi:hypothetical protein